MFVDEAVSLVLLGRVPLQEKSMNAPQSSPTPIAYSPKDACAALGIGLTSLYLEIARGRIEARKAGNRTLIPVESLLDYLAALPLADIRSGQNAVAPSK